MGIRGLILFIMFAGPTFAQSPTPTVVVTMATDQTDLFIGETTLLHVRAEIFDVQPNNGIYAYALNITKDVPAPIAFVSVTQLGDPLDFLSASGILNVDGLHDIYGLDGGFFDDPLRGIGAAFEHFTIELSAARLGAVHFSASVAGVADSVGVPSGFLLQRPGAVGVDFCDGVSVNVVPEPSCLIIAGVALAFTWPIRKKLLCGNQKRKAI